MKDTTMSGSDLCSYAAQSISLMQPGDLRVIHLLYLYACGLAKEEKFEDALVTATIGLSASISMDDGKDKDVFADLLDGITEMADLLSNTGESNITCIGFEDLKATCYRLKIPAWTYCIDSFFLQDAV